jgi:uncharacterized cupin superfamily protein
MSDNKPTDPRVLVRASERGPDFAIGHPYDPNVEAHCWTVSRMAGLGRIAVNLEWLPPGKHSAPLHVHHREEEWVYVVEGRGVAELADVEHAIGPGDFLGFPPGVAHHVRNDSGDRLVLLVGGEVIPDVDVADFPRLGRRLVRIGTRIAIYPFEAEIPFFPPGGPQELPAELLGPRAPQEPARILVRASERKPALEFHHPQNRSESEVHLTALSRLAGLRRVAVLHARVPAGRESFVFHVHQRDEEWLFVLSGRGVAELGDREVEIGPGDFLGFPARGPAHNLRAARGEELVYVQGGDAWSRDSIDIVDFPRLGLRRTFVGTRDAMTFPLDMAVERRGA